MILSLSLTEGLNVQKFNVAINADTKKKIFLLLISWNSFPRG